MEQTSATMDRAMIRTTMFRRSCAGVAPAPAPPRASRIWRRRIRGPLVIAPPAGIMAPALPRSGAEAPVQIILYRVQPVSRMQCAHGQFGVRRVDQDADLD